MGLTSVGNQIEREPSVPLPGARDYSVAEPECCGLIEFEYDPVLRKDSYRKDVLCLGRTHADVFDHRHSAAVEQTTPVRDVGYGLVRIASCVVEGRVGRRVSQVVYATGIALAVDGCSCRNDSDIHFVAFAVTSTSAKYRKILT